MDRNSIDRYLEDKRIVLTLDAGGTKLEFSAQRGKESLFPSFILPASPDNLDNYLMTMVSGFSRAIDILRSNKKNIAAISFSFPGPAHYEEGIIDDLPNLPAFRGGVALKAYLEKEFNLPVFINNDGNLFALGEWIDGLLPWVNSRLKGKGKNRKYRNLIGVTLGTGFGCGIVIDGKVITGDNSSGGEIWLFPNKHDPRFNVESGVGKRALFRYYSEKTGLPYNKVPDPITLANIARGQIKGDKSTAARAFQNLGIVAGDAIAHALSLIDGLVVIGGGLSKARDLYLPSLIGELNSTIKHIDGRDIPRLVMKVYNLEEQAGVDEFIHGHEKKINIPGSSKHLTYNADFRTGIGLTRLGTGKAVSLGAYIFALMHLDADKKR